MSARRNVRFSSTVILLVTLALVAAACAGSSSHPHASPTTTAVAIVRGGTLVLGAAQEPSCADWYAPCGKSSWGVDMMASQTLPRAFDVEDGVYRPSPLLEVEPTMDVGPPQRVTYRLNPRAVWSDGQPITSLDLKFTADIAKATSASVAHVAVDTVGDTDPQTAVVTFKEPTPSWRDAFARILPKHLLEGKDRAAEMRNGYSWSGGPWLIDHWTKGQEIKLVPSPTYWGKRPNLDAVVFKVVTDSAAYLADYKTGQLDMVYLQGAQPEVAEIKDLPASHFEATVGLGYEFAMFNTLKPPLDSLAVRQALAYATDRDAIVTQTSGPIQPSIRAAQAFMSAGNQRWYSEPFKRYGRDLAKVTDLMAGDGWAHGPDGVWAKAGFRAAIELNGPTGNRRRELYEEILRSQWKEAGFDVTVRNTTPATLLGDWVPKGAFQVGFFGNSPGSTDPNNCQNFCSRFTPTEANGFLGGNVSRISSKAVDDAWQAVATELDDAKRLEGVHRAQKALADEVPGLPLVGGLDIVAYNSVRVGGPVKANPTGVFFNLNEWYCKARCGT